MKKNRILKIGLLALALTLVTASLVSGTFAKYITTASGTGTVTVAKWEAKINDADTLYQSAATFNPFAYRDSADDVAANRVAPGTEGGFTFKYVTFGSEVNRKITVSLKATTAADETKLGTIDNLFFYDKDNVAFKPTVDDTVVFEKSLAFNALKADANGTYTVPWDWVFGDVTNDAVDTPDGIAAVNASLTLSVTIEQVDTTT